MSFYELLSILHKALCSLGKPLNRLLHLVEHTLNFQQSMLVLLLPLALVAVEPIARVEVRTLFLVVIALQGAITVAVVFYLKSRATETEHSLLVKLVIKLRLIL